jgi:hypothetical protein
MPEQYSHFETMYRIMLFMIAIRKKQLKQIDFEVMLSKTFEEGTEMTPEGRPLHIRAAATGNARSSTVKRRVY